MSLPANVLQRLQGRAAQADQIVAQLRAQLQVLKNNAGLLNVRPPALIELLFTFLGAYACIAEEKKLSDENAVLKQEIQSLKTRLVKAEIKNGG